MLLAAAFFSSFTVDVYINSRWWGVHATSEALHATMEAIGATLAVLMAIILLQKKDDEHGGKFFLLALGFLSMGILDAFHAVSTEGHGLVMIHGLTNVAGGVWFSLIWFPALASDKDAGWKRAAPWAVVGSMLLLGAFTLLGGKPTPAMLHDGDFTASARAIHSFAGFLFVASAVRLVNDYYRYERLEFCLFIPMTALFGAASFSYLFASMWGITWWLWHVLRLAAYFMVLGVMIADRRQVESELRKSRQVSGDRLVEIESLSRQHKLILEAADEGIMGMDVRGEHTFVNHNAAVMLGYDCDELIGRRSHPIWHHTRPDGSPYVEAECNIYATLRDGVVRRIDDEVFWKKDGTSFPVEYATTPVYEDGRIAGTVVTFRDITSRKVAEEHLKEALTELERSNKELEEFAYIASHDLQEPLRMVSSFLQLIESKHKGKLDEKTDQYIAFAVDGAMRMQNLIVDLLTYSRLFRMAEFSPVDLKQVLKEAMSNLTAVIRESNATVTNDDLPTVSGDKLRLVQLFQNLISNAIKFRKPDTPPLVHVSAKKEGREWVFSVRDNGIGIGPEYFHRIFQIFQRLHTREEYPGTGIGLTLCKKIVEGHNGRIWVESIPGEGSTFYFALPSKGRVRGRGPGK